MSSINIHATVPICTNHLYILLCMISLRTLDVDIISATYSLLWLIDKTFVDPPERTVNKLDELNVVKKLISYLLQRSAWLCQVNYALYLVHVKSPLIKTEKVVCR